MPQPTYNHMTMPQELYDAVCDAVSQGFADSYLTGAVLFGKKLTPRTLTAWQKMSDSYAFKMLLKNAGIELVKPLPFHLQAAPLSHKEIYRVVH
jgi:hypothetical protein